MLMHFYHVARFASMRKSRLTKVANFLQDVILQLLQLRH